MILFRQCRANFDGTNFVLKGAFLRATKTVPEASEVCERHSELCSCSLLIALGREAVTKKQRLFASSKLLHHPLVIF